MRTRQLTSLDTIIPLIDGALADTSIETIPAGEASSVIDTVKPRVFDKLCLGMAVGDVLMEPGIPGNPSLSVS